MDILKKIKEKKMKKLLPVIWIICAICGCAKEESENDDGLGLLYGYELIGESIDNAETYLYSIGFCYDTTIIMSNGTYNRFRKDDCMCMIKLTEPVEYVNIHYHENCNALFESIFQEFSRMPEMKLLGETAGKAEWLYEGGYNVDLMLNGGIVYVIYYIQAVNSLL